MLRLSAPLEYTGHNFTATQLKNDLNDFVNQRELDNVSLYYDWQQAIVYTDLEDDIAMLFAIQYPRYLGHFRRNNGETQCQSDS